jgi:hypothetical protein
VAPQHEDPPLIVDDRSGGDGLHADDMVLEALTVR